MGILTHERKCQRRISLAASVRLPFRHMWGVQKAEAPIGLFAYPSDEGGSTGFFLFLLFFFFFGASVREPSGDRLVAQRPRVSTREYGGWNRTGERGRSGDMSEMVKQKQRDASSFTESQGTLIWESFSKAVYSLKKSRLQFIPGLSQRFPSVLDGASLFFMKYREGWAKQMNTRTFNIIGRASFSPFAHFSDTSSLRMLV